MSYVVNCGAVDLQLGGMVDVARLDLGGWIWEAGCVWEYIKIL